MRFVITKKAIIWTIVVALVILAITLGLVFGLKGKNDNNSSRGLMGAIVSNGIGCAEIGLEIIDDGGSQVDAAIATLICEGIMLPHSMGIGGGFIAIVYTKATGKFETITARETAPAAAHKDMFANMTKITGPLAGAVPGELIGYWELHKKYGRVPWRNLFQRTIKLCKEGHFVSKFLATALSLNEDIVRAEPSLAEIFIREDGSIQKEGDYMKRPQLGATLQLIAENGIDEMYNGGSVGKMFVEDIQRMGGIITEQDLKNYKVLWETDKHIVGNITGGFKLHTTPLPSSGGILSFMVNVMSDLYTSDQNTYWQRIVETWKHAFGQRTHLGDMANDAEMRESIQAAFDHLTTDEYAREVQKLIFDDKTSQDMAYYGAKGLSEEDHGTANMAVLMPNGDAITITSTINNYLGAKVRSTRTGIILNDEMTDFSFPNRPISGMPPSPENFIKPGKRPMSSMCPAIILDKDGNVRMLVGAAGGKKITTAVATAIFKYLVLNETIRDSIDNGRLHHQLAPMRLDVEEEVPLSLRTHLEKLGHKVYVLPPGSGFAAITAIGMRDGHPDPFFDHRRVGSTAFIQAKNKMLH